MNVVGANKVPGVVLDAVGKLVHFDAMVVWQTSPHVLFRHQSGRFPSDVNLSLVNGGSGQDVSYNLIVGMDFVGMYVRIEGIDFAKDIHRRVLMQPNHSRPTVSQLNQGRSANPSSKDRWSAPLDFNIWWTPMPLNSDHTRDRLFSEKNLITDKDDIWRIIRLSPSVNVRH